MIELFKAVWLIVRAIFTEWVPAFLSLDLGPIGDLKDAIGLVFAIIAVFVFAIRQIKKSL